VILVASQALCTYPALSTTWNPLEASGRLLRLIPAFSPEQVHGAPSPQANESLRDCPRLQKVCEFQLIAAPG
jgi:hypothetical protein